MRALAITGIVTASWMPLTSAGSDMRATPPSLRMSAGTRSSAITAAAPASSAIFACSGVTTSMITPPLSISARPDLTRNVAVSFTATMVPALLQLERLDAVRVRRFIQRVHPVGERLDEAHERAVAAHVGRAVRRVVQLVVGELRHLGQRGVRDRDRGRAAVACELHRAHDQRVRP